MSGAPAWHDRANCAGEDPAVFFLEPGDTADAARAICAACPVRLDCLEHALDNGERFGIWGGFTEPERRQMRRQRALARRPAS